MRYWKLKQPEDGGLAAAFCEVTGEDRFSCGIDVAIFEPFG